MTTKELKNLILDSNKENEFEEFIKNFYEDNLELVIGDITLKHFESKGGEGQGDTMVVLFKSVKNGEEEIYQINANYNSEMGTDFYDIIGSFYKVKPIQVMRTEYQRVKEE